MNKTFAIITAALLTLAAVASAATSNITSPIVRVICTYQNYHPYFPWQKLKPAMRVGFGVAIDKTHILTTENLVRSQTLIEIKRPQSGKKITARLIMADCQVDLALLEIATNSLPGNIDYPTLDDKLPLKSQITITQIDETSGIQRGRGQVVKASVEDLPSATYSMLQYDILTRLNVTGEGAPVFHKDKLAGLMLSYHSSSRTGKMIPALFIKRFINDAKSGEYSGFATAGFSWNPLIDPVKRRYLGVNAPDTGVLVTSVLYGETSNSTIQPNDVILSWDGRPIDNLGFYQDKDFGRLLFPHLVKGKRKPGDKVKAQIVREGEIHQVEVTLSKCSEEDDLIPENTAGKPVPYIITGGIIIQEITGRLLRSSNNWQNRADPLLAHLYMTRRHNPEYPGDRVVIFTKTLNDPINISYQNFNFLIIEKVNGKPIRNIHDLFNINDHDGGINRLSLHGIDVDIVLDKNKLQAADRRIAEHYRLPALQRRPDEL